MRFPQKCPRSQSSKAGQPDWLDSGEIVPSWNWNNQRFSSTWKDTISSKPLFSVQSSTVSEPRKTTKQLPQASRSTAHLASDSCLIPSLNAPSCQLATAEQSKIYQGPTAQHLQTHSFGCFLAEDLQVDPMMLFRRLKFHQLQTWQNLTMSQTFIEWVNCRNTACCHGIIWQYLLIESHWDAYLLWLLFVSDTTE